MRRFLDENKDLGMISTSQHH